MKQIITMPIGEVKPYLNNPRVNRDAVEKVAASLRSFGWRQPIVVDKDHVIIAGHTRLEAAKSLRYKEVPVLVADDLTEEQVRAYRLADNKTAEFSLWDLDKLDEELAEIADIDMTLFGFDFPELDEIGEAEEDDYEPEDEIEPRVKAGEVYQLGEHRLICGDCTEKAVIDRLLDGEQVDMVFTDPPYGISIQHEDGRVGSEKKANSKGKRVTGATKFEPFENDETTETAQKAYDLMQEYTDKMIVWGGNYFTGFLPFSDGWIIWDKRVDIGVRNNFADGEMAWCSFHTPVRIYHQLWNGMIREGEHGKRLHPTQKPVRMLAEVIEDFTDEGDVILDVFGGSGSTLIACEQSGRRCMMSELSEYYCTVIIDRWETFTGKKAVLLEGGVDDGKDGQTTQRD